MVDISTVSCNNHNWFFNSCNNFPPHCHQYAAVQPICRRYLKLLYASSAWAGFITAADRQRVDAFLRRSIRCGFCPSDIPLFEDLLKASDQKLFGKVIHNKHHLLYKYLPPPSVAPQNYHLRPRIHNRQLPDHHLGHLTDSNIFTRLLYNDIY